MRALPYLGRCHVGTRGKNGWLTVVGSEDIFWFEFNDSPIDALDFSVQTLNILSEYIDDVGMLESISKTCGGLAAALKKVRNAVVDNYS